MQFFTSVARSRSAALAGLVMLAVLTLGQNAEVHAGPPGDGGGSNTLVYWTPMQPSGHTLKLHVEYKKLFAGGVTEWRKVEDTPVNMDEQLIVPMPGFSSYGGTVPGLYSNYDYRYYVFDETTDQMVGGYGSITFP